MPLFQKSVINKYLQQLDQAGLKNAYDKFLEFYGDKERIENIRLLKEENYQEGFLREIFVEVLGYTINPDKNYNLTTEFKNETDSKKADGAILENGKAIGVIELKSTKTPNLESIKEQAFSYKNNQSNCRYVITSNFERLRFYIDNATEFEEFNLFELDFERFKIFYLFLCSKNIFSGTTAKLKKESLLHEENVTDNLYKDYSKFKKDIFDNLVKNNPDENKLLLFHKSQKLLDRILFVLFAEDRGLLPPNAISRIIKQWKDLEKLDEPVTLYSRFVKLFGHLDVGHKYENWEIPAYNGGLFRKDDLLDNLIIEDEILEKQSLKLSNYDFNTEVDVNILGHIFEHSISEIEQVAAEIEGTDTDKEKSRRKKEGIFYTPKYITKYIVENTVGALCGEKKKELEIDFIENEIIENSRTAKGKLTAKAKELLGRVDEYREYLLSLKILDPACGSGAFLNQALEFLISEHEMLDGYRNEILQESFIIPDVSKSILENNLYGVDINEESVEIAKLSLWLRTAEKGRKLSDLNNNIKCGNSLIDDPEVAGEKAFNWEKEFTDIMQDGGFDVVIGNPPYVRQENILKIFKDYLSKNYNIGENTSDLYTYFYELSLNLSKKDAYISFITPNKWFKTKYGEKLREYLRNYNIIEIIDFFELRIFADASTEPQIIIIRNIESNCEIKYSPIKNINTFENNNFVTNKSSKDNLSKNEWLFLADEKSNVINKIKSNAITLGKYTDNGIKLGIKTALNKAFIISKEVKERILSEDPQSTEIIEPYIQATDIKKWHLENKNGHYLINTGYDLDITKNNYSGVFNHLNKYLKELGQRLDQGKSIYNLRACDYYDKFYQPKIFFIYTAINHYFYFDEEGYFVNNSCFIISNSDKYLAAILNSKIFIFYKKIFFVAFGDPSGRGRSKLDYNKMLKFPIPLAEECDKAIFEKLVDIQKESSASFSAKIKLYITRITTNFPVDKLSNKLKEFYNHDFKTFLSELKKKKVKLSLKQQEEWEEYFNEYKKEINSLQETISQTDKEIDKMVYELYGLTEEEIKIVEESVG
ncbi:MAG TPA: Eco57I restriction-modification methylase domain-containing protein [Ignavibacteriaceae bacterium]|nr:Eco57I restriction-modification methylase domain-containing protein [Ignavibacteriaceae bacterium]